MIFDFLLRSQTPARYLKVVFENPKNGERAALHFRLDSHSFVQKWIKVLETSIQNSHQILDDGVFYGRCVSDRQNILEVMKTSVGIINELAIDPSMRIEMQPYLEMDQNFLNDLHKEFERLSSDLGIYSPSVRTMASKALVDLNASIHQYEGFASWPTVSDDDSHHSPNFSFDVNFVGGKIKDLDDEDFEFFTPHRKYGELYLNYNTVGVPVYYAFLHDERKLPVPQRTYKADFTVSFGETAQFERREELGRWLRTHFDWDVNNKKLALGYIPLGQCLEAEMLSPKDIAALVKGHRKVVEVELLQKLSAHADRQ